MFPALTELQYVVHEENALRPRILHWRSNNLARYNELMSHVYENIEVSYVSNGYVMHTFD